MTQTLPSNRRVFLGRLSSMALGLAGSRTVLSAFDTPPKSVAGIATWYIKGSHADVIFGKILKGWAYDGGPGPNLRLASLYLDQFPGRDMARALAAEHGVPIFDRIEDALTLGGDGIAVDGVLSIGEHGEYPWNEKGQHLYPRRRFFEEITDAFETHGEAVPVFNDKHFGPVWEDALWMYRRAQDLSVPLMAGSSLPVSFRSPDVTIPMNSDIESAVGVGYSGLDIYGIHTLEVFQSFVERRRGGESGVAWVQWVGADRMWDLVDEGTIPSNIVDAALAAVPKSGNSNDPRRIRGENVGLFLFEYVDGLRGAVFMLPGYAAGCGIAVKLKGVDRPIATRAEERREPHYPHFAYLLKAIETMVITGKPAYPAERTLLTTGILDRALTSRFENGRKRLTPELNIRYQPADYPHAPNPILTKPYRP